MTAQMISIADLQGLTKTVTVPTDLGDLEVVYRPNAMTPLKEAELARLGRASDDDEEAAWALATLFCEIVDALPNLSGPLVDDEGTELVAAGEVVPVEPETMVRLSSRVIMGVFTALQRAAEDDSERAAKPTRNGATPSRTRSRRGSSTR